jgi:hypothetical protein
MDGFKVDADDNGTGGDDTLDALCYLVARKPREIMRGSSRECDGYKREGLCRRG